VKNRLRLAKVIVKNKMSRFYGSLCEYSIYIYILVCFMYVKLLRRPPDQLFPDLNSGHVTSAVRRA